MRLAVFDLDGTLVDTAPDLADSTNVVLAAHGLAPVPFEVLAHHIGFGARRMVISALEEQGVPLDTIDMERLHADYIAHYRSRIARLSKPFPEMLAAVDALEGAGVALAVCTNKSEALAQALLSELGLMDRFTALAGGDTFAASKPDPAHLLGTIGRAGGSAAQSVFVGDSTTDFNTARAAKVPIVGVTYGYSDVPMAELGPDVLCGPGDDVAAAVLSLF